MGGTQTSVGQSAGVSYPEFLKQRIFSPLGITSAFFGDSPFDGEANCDTLMFFHGRTHWHITSRFSIAPPQLTRFNHRDDDAILNSGSRQLFQDLSRRVETIPTCESRRNDWPWLGSKKS